MPGQKTNKQANKKPRMPTVREGLFPRLGWQGYSILPLKPLLVELQNILHNILYFPLTLKRLLVLVAPCSFPVVY